MLNIHVVQDFVFTSTTVHTYIHTYYQCGVEGADKQKNVWLSKGSDDHCFKGLPKVTKGHNFQKIISNYIFCPPTVFRV